MKQKQEAKQVKRLQKELNQTKAALKEAVEQWQIVQKALETSREDNETKEAVIKKLTQLSEGRNGTFAKDDRKG